MNAISPSGRALLADKDEGAECGTCYYAMAGECHRLPPALLAGGPPNGMWPKVREDDWCGAYERDVADDA